MTTWPMFEIRLSTPDLDLRHVTEADLDQLAEVMPADVEQDPSLPSYPRLAPAHERAVRVHQDYWRARATWCPDSWALGFAVRHGDDLIGFQGLEGDDFALLRTVDSSSFLATVARGRGWGTQMRAAVLTLAFEELGAQAAVSSAWSTNLGSLGVSRALGYVDNGVAAKRRGGRVGELAHLRLTREQWARTGWAERVTVTGVEACRPFLGLD